MRPKVYARALRAKILRFRSFCPNLAPTAPRSQISRFAPTSRASRSNLAPSAQIPHLSRKSWPPAQFALPAQILRVPIKLCAFCPNLAPHAQIPLFRPNLAPPAQIWRLKSCASRLNQVPLARISRLVPESRASRLNIVPCAQMSCLVPKSAPPIQILCLLPKSFSSRLQNIASLTQILRVAPKSRVLRPNLAPCAQTSCVVP